MSRASILIVIGVLVMLLSFMGLPSSVLHVLLPIFGAVVVLIGILMRADRVRASREAMTPPPASHESSVIS